MTAKKVTETPKDETPETPETETVDVDKAPVPVTKEDQAVAKLQKGQFTPTRSVVCSENRIIGRGQRITPEDLPVPAAKQAAAFERLVKAKRIYKV